MKSDKVESDKLPLHVIESIRRSIEQYRNGQSISLEEFKEKYLFKKSVVRDKFKVSQKDRRR
jgi:hypothetical protein